MLGYLEKKTAIDKKDVIFRHDAQRLSAREHLPDPRTGSSKNHIRHAKTYDKGSSDYYKRYISSYYKPRSTNPTNPTNPITDQDHTKCRFNMTGVLEERVGEKAWDFRFKKFCNNLKGRIGL